MGIESNGRYRTESESKETKMVIFSSAKETSVCYGGEEDGENRERWLGEEKRLIGPPDLCSHSM